MSDLVLIALFGPVAVALAYWTWAWRPGRTKTATGYTTVATSGEHSYLLREAAGKPYYEWRAAGPLLNTYDLGAMQQVRL